MRKHGFDNFSVEFLAEGNDWNHLCELEIEAIKKYNTFIGPGYNVTRGGDGTDGYKFSGAQLAKRTERGLSEQHKENISKNNSCYWRGKAIPDETVNKIKKVLQGKHVKSCVVNGILYGSAQEASDKIGFCVTTIRKRCRNPNFPEYRYISGTKYSFGKARPCIVNGIEYESVLEASRKSGIDPRIIRKRIKNKNLIKYAYID